ncbi:hypothetical protein EIP91_007326 [Steccherinum ochraceum]|uniref:Uncharacterized protein n=1 Tax=Steccherinum ochraceum TaxID=92696 RepID=A0A4R0RYZ4_9APHY|nr:hypothetical protein EIP91_007326 [Steccherinum ochraceum]
MIRRDPTLIALSDNDVQDVRELLRRRAYENHVAASSAAGGTGAAAAGSASVAQGSSVSSDPYRDHAAMRAAKAKLTREERLGFA